jgi:peptide chain release factor subunit 1
MTDSQAQVERYEFRRKLEDMSKIRGRATELITLYVPPGRAIADVTNYLRNEYSQAGNIKSRTTRKNVLWAIESLIGKLKFYRVAPQNGMIFFVGAKDLGGNRTEYISEILYPPEPITSFMYRCDSQFFLEPLMDQVKFTDIYGLMIIDRSECTIGYLRGKRIVHVKTRESNVPSKHGRGGQSARRFERLIEQAAHDWFKRMADLAFDVFSPQIGQLNGILLGGPGPTKEYFAQEEYLHHDLRKKLMTPYFDVGYTNEFGLRELVERAAERISTLEISKEKSLLDRFLREVRGSEAGLATYGEAHVRNALSLGAVDILLISEGLRKVRVEWECTSCGKKQEKTYEGSKDPEPEPCSCGGDLEKKKEEDIVREMATIAEKYSARIELISTDSEQGGIFFKVFGGIGAILRFRV